MQEGLISRAGLILGVLLSLLLSCVLGGCDLFPWWDPPLVPTSIYAENVAAMDVCTGGNDYCDGTEAVGPPDETSPWTGRFISLGGGHIVATMEQCFTNGEGADLFVYEVGGAGQGGIDEPFDVFVSSDRITWIAVATEVENDPGAVFSSIELLPLTGSYRYVKLVDHGSQGGRTPGADIDALEARYAAPCTQSEPTILRGVDVNARHEDSINWQSVYDAGYRFVFVKATSGDADPQALRNTYLEDQVEEAEDEDLAVGVYHFAYAGFGNSATDEAAWFLNEAGDYIREGYLRPALDIEDDEELPEGQRNSSLSAEALTAWVDEWMDTVEALTGVEPILYVSSSYAKDHLLPSIEEYDVWIAEWDCTTDGSPKLHGIWDDWAFWQYYGPEGCGSNEGDDRVPGIDDDVDLDVFNGGMTQLNEYRIPPGAGWNPPNDSLIAYYDFNEAVMTTLLDRSQYLNFGDIQQLEGVVPGKVGHAYSFDGVNDWVKVPDSESLRSIRRFTISCWVKPASLPPVGRAPSTGIVAYGEGWQGMWELRLMGDGALFLLLNWNTPSETDVVSSARLTVGTWYRVAATFDGETARVYVDGRLEGEEACPELLHSGAASYMAIGLNFPGANEYFHGLIDELRIYNEVIAP